MADPRYKHGIFNGGYQHSKRLQVVPVTPATCPLLCGWQPVDRRPSGLRVWQLDNHPDITMRRVESTDPPTEDEWIVFLLGEAWATYSGPVDEITQDIIKSLDVPAPPSNSNNGEDDYALEARA